MLQHVRRVQLGKGAVGEARQIDGVADEGADGLDNDSDGKVDESPYDVDGDGLFTGAGDDPGELETLPPYRFPLRGIEIRLRCYEPSSRQVRQVTIRHSFVPR
jgi:hypothetical protein